MMNSQIEKIEELAIPVPITQEIKQNAEQFAKKQPTRAKADRVYLNTLAVRAVYNYLNLLGIATDLIAGDSWNTAIQCVADVADLEVLGSGRLECRPLIGEIHSDTICYVPPEVQSDRIAYVVVQIDPDSSQANLLGFSKTVATSQLKLEQLQPIDHLLEYLMQLKHSHASPINLSQWLEGVFHSSWQALNDAIVKTRQPTFAFRSQQKIERAKRIELMQQEAAVDLIISLMPEDEIKMDILVEIYPPKEQYYLPKNLQLILLDDEGGKLMEAKAQNNNQNIQFEFIGDIGDRFSIQLALNDIKVTEKFVI
ncbi:DUF1822 family protein [Candidatus Gracilibacteria bacterium]|nr:DUF1822 family protein [Candidatus Gracilibacteria bacterium]NJM87638.1 DUF1822 family protein [Hydrococcus sp. RU_2_2]NJP19219.1 DUF1822 family protein [Hydrococcus sp. CRU_1_1]